MPADLHCHTKISDGSATLEDVVLLAKRRGLSTISITDHDTLAGVTRGKILGDRYGVRVIPGIEFSCWDYKRGRPAHLLGYMFSFPDRLEGMCARIGDARKKAAAQMIQKITRFYPILPDMIVKTATGSTNIFVQHIMMTLMNAGFADAMFGELFDKILGPNGSCRATFEYPDVYETLELLLSAGAVTVLAHPFRYDNMELLPELAEKGLHGAEVWSPHSDADQTAELLEQAAALGLLTTGGSDFHGMNNTRPCPIGTYTAPDESLEALLALKTKIDKAKN